MARPVGKPGSIGPGTPLARLSGTPRLPVAVLGLSLSLFSIITYVLCVCFDLLFPDQAMHPLWQGFLPGFAWLT